MKVIALNGSPRKGGNTFTALSAAAEALKKEEIDTEILQLGGLVISGCKACGFCAQNGRCVIDDAVNEIGPQIAEADGLIVGSPVYYAGINGTLKCFLDRLFYAYGSKFRFKPAAAVVALRRGGAISSFDTINHYFQITEMLVTPTMYWNDVHGAAAGECVQDTEAMQMMEAVGRNMAYLIKLRQESTVPVPEKLSKLKFNYIR